ncbi:MAG: hypothetical protein ACK4SY_08220 [Pyrobaculum sp.]
MAEEVWKKLKEDIITTLTGELDREIVRACYTNRQFCEEKLGVYVYNTDDDKDKLFTMTCIDYVFMGLRCSGEGHYYIDGVRLVEGAVSALAEETPLTRDEALTVLAKAAEEYPEWTAHAIPYIAFLPHWAEEGSEYFHKADQFVEDLLKDAADLMPDKAKEIKAYIERGYIPLKIWEKIYPFLRDNIPIATKVEYTVGHVCIAEPEKCREIGVYIYTMVDDPDEAHSYIMSIHHSGIRFKLHIWGSRFVVKAIDGIVNYARDVGIKLNDEKVEEQLYDMSVFSPSSTAQLTINGALYYLNGLGTRVKAVVDTQRLDKFVRGHA